MQRRLLSWGVFLLPVAVLSFIFRSTLFASAIPSHLDVLLNYMPYYHSMAAGGAVVKAGIISGFPILLSVSTTWFNPLNTFLFRFVDAFDAFRLLDIFYILGAYAVTYGFARHLKLSHAASALAGLVYLCAGQVMLWSGTIIIAGYYIVLPGTAWLLAVAAERAGWRRLTACVAAGVLLGLGWRMGHVQFLIYAHGFVAAYWLYLGWRARATSSAYHWLRWGALMLLMFTISFAVGAAQILPILEFVSVTDRSGGVSLPMAFAHAYLPYHLIHYLLPSFALPEPFPYRTALQNYLGIIPLALLIIGAVNARSVIRRYPQGAFFLGAGLFCLLASIQYSPIVYLFHILPFLKTFREAPRIMFVGDFVLALFIGYTVDYIAEHRAQMDLQLQRFWSYAVRLLVWVVAPVVILATLLRTVLFAQVEALAQQYFILYQLPNLRGGYSKEHYLAVLHDRLVQMIGQFSLTDWNIVVLLVGLCSLLWLIRSGVTGRKFVVYALCLTALNFSLQYVNRLHAIDRQSYLTPPATAQFILAEEASNSEPFRIFAPLNDTALFDESTRCRFPKYSGWDISTDEFALRRELLEPNLPLLYGLESADGYEPYMPSRTADVIGYAGSRFDDANRFGANPNRQSGTIADNLGLFTRRLNVLRMMNVKYVVSHYPLSSTELTLRQSTTVGACESSVFIYELTKPWPRYFVTDTIIGANGATESQRFIDTMNRIASASAPIAVFDEDAVPPSRLRSTQVVHPQLSGDTMTFNVIASHPSVLVVGNQWLPGWRATVDGIQAAIRRVNWMYMAVEVPQGAHMVILRYQ